MSPPDAPCAWCGSTQTIVHVHGHGQCATCGVNVDPCCGGANVGDEAVASDSPPVDVDPALFARLFLQLGGATATVTEQSLLFALTQRLSTDLDDARLVLEAGERIGHIVAVPRGCYRLREHGGPGGT